jgi:hypothetical protein
MSGRNKRWRAPTAKPGELKIAYGKIDRYNDPDLCVAWGAGGADKSDARTALHALTEKRMAYAFPSMGIEERPSLIEELEARGYDITTLRFTISRKVDTLTTDIAA